MKPVVSVIVPIYNNEEYLPRCLNSLYSQSLHHLEIILVVDAGSNAASRRIAFEYGAKDSRVIIIESEARGASAVRNVGLRHSTGSYIGFTDSDDYLLPDMFTSLYAFAAEQSLDIAVSGIWRDNNIGEPPYSLMRYPAEITHVPQINRHQFLYKWVLSNQSYFVWNKLYRKSFLDQHSLRFDEQIKMGEDAVFNLCCFAKADSAGSIDQAHYIYFNRPGSQQYAVNTTEIVHDFQQRWNAFQETASSLPSIADRDSLLAIAALRLVTNALFLYKIRGYALEDACEFTAFIIANLELQRYLEAALLPDVLTIFARVSHMDERSLLHFRKLAEAVSHGKEALLEWQLYFKNVIEKKG
ncbi:glycosyltransferase [Cohnella sp. LGH]|uniref:glycosyltransferase family 2 protein n=1 Tax=Cohnella sp. LGH TaxID=1619153 RepID=UPI001ADAE773|nr:glycosyltransferase [Cohnella sp. LGH]QTH42281.1 glycosyltransferase [Cohnella sp. LGH]